MNTLKKSNKLQQDADIYLLLNYSTWFGRPSRPSSGVHKTVVAASGTDHTIWEANKKSGGFLRFQILQPAQLIRHVTVLTTLTVECSVHCACVTVCAVSHVTSPLGFLMYSACNPKDNYDMSASVFLVQFNGFMSITS